MKAESVAWPRVFRSGSTARNGRHILLLGPVTAFLAVFFVYPLSGTLLQSLFDPQFTLVHYLEILKHPVYARVIWNTIEVSFLVALACVILGYPVAFCLGNYESKWTKALLYAVLLPFWISVLIRTYAWMILLGRFGIINEFLKSWGLVDKPLELMFNRLGVCVGLVYVLLPYAILPMLSVMRGIDRTLLRAAVSLGSTSWETFRHVFFPLSLPGVGAGFLLTFIMCSGAFITPALMGGSHETVITMSIETQLNLVRSWGFASALSVLLLTAVLTLFYLFARFFGIGVLLGGLNGSQTAHEGLEGKYAFRGIIPRRLLRNERLLSAREQFFRHIQTGADRVRAFLSASTPAFLHGIPWGRIGLVVFCSIMFCFLVIPVCIVVPIAFSNDTMLHFPPRSWGYGLFHQYFMSSNWMRATWNSFRVAVPVMFLATILGTSAAYSLVRGKFRIKACLFALLFSPLIIPHIVSAVSTYLFFAKLKLIGTVSGLVLAHTVLAIPYVIIVMTSAIGGLDERLEQASMSLGASRVRTFLHVTLPLIRPGIVTAMLFAFIASFDELITAMFISGMSAITLPKQMWDGIRDEINPIIAAVAALLIFLSTLLMLLSYCVRRKDKILSTLSADKNQPLI